MGHPPDERGERGAKPGALRLFDHNETWESGYQSIFSVDRKILLDVYRSSRLDEVVHFHHRLQTSDFGD